MGMKITYRLSNPGYTIYHRAALGGLAATVHAWRNNPPQGVESELQHDFVRIEWGDELTDQEALRRILQSSFKLTPDKLIDLPGQGIGFGQNDLRLAVHNGICGTFLQHNKMRPSEKDPRRMELKTADDEVGEIFSYKAVNSYAHQKAQGTGLLEMKHNGDWPELAGIPQSVIPGAMSGATELNVPPEEAVLLLFLMVGSAIFLLRPRTWKEKAQYCVVVPDVISLTAFAKALHRITAAGQSIKRFSNTYLGRVVGGAEEAALRFLIDLNADDIASERSVSGCLAVAMGKVAWDANQINRSQIIRLRADYGELNVFREANKYLGKAKVIKGKKNEAYAFPASPIPELIAANLGGDRHWCANFRELVSRRKDFERMSFVEEGLRAMKEAIKDVDDQVIICTFQQAWRLTMAGLGERARRDNLEFGRLVVVERERIRNAILRAKTADMLAAWFLRFCADATSGGPLSALRQDGDRVRKFVFNPRNFERFQNLCLFALVSYASDDQKAIAGGKS
jgi:CRISPR-associated protein Cas8a1/Csx13